MSRDRTRIAVTNPFCWPEVRRGGERLQYDLCAYLAARGHDVTLLASAPAGHADLAEAPDGVARAIVERGRDWHLRHYWTPAHAFGWQARAQIKALDAAAIHALTYFDAAAVIAALPKRRRPRLVAQSIGIPVRSVYRRMPLDGRMMARTIAEADVVQVLSTFAADHMAQGYGRMPQVLPAPVDISAFDAKTAPPERPMILFAGDADEPRKGAHLLVRAAGPVMARHPELELVFTGNASDATRAALMALCPHPDRLRFTGTGNRAALPALYRAASVLVLPSEWEAFGLVLVEAMAAGTPVVAARAGGGADIVTDPQTGVLSDLTPEALTRTITTALELAQDPATIPACRARAQDFGWDVLGPDYEAALT